MNISGIIALVGVICLFIGVAALLTLIAAPTWPLIIFGVILLIASNFIGGGWVNRN